MRAIAVAVLLLGLVSPASSANPACGPEVPACPGIHPGVPFLARVGNQVSVHFVFAAVDGIYVGSCAHCVVGGPANPTPADGWFPSALPNRTIDTSLGSTTPPDADIVWTDPAWLSGTDVTHDVALLKVRPHLWWAVSPDLLTWGGPTGIHDQPWLDPGPVRQSGQGLGSAGTPLESRQGVLLDWAGGARFSYVGAAQDGDSGSPVLDADNRAVGFLTHATGTSGDNVSPGERGTIHGLHIEHFMATVEAATGIQLRLVLAGEDPVEVQRDMAAVATLGDDSNGRPVNEAPLPWVVPLAALLVLAVRRRGRA